MRLVEREKLRRVVINIFSGLKVFWRIKSKRASLEMVGVEKCGVFRYFAMHCRGTRRACAVGECTGTY